MTVEEAIRFILDNYSKMFSFQATFDIKKMRADSEGTIKMANELKVYMDGRRYCR